MGDYQNGLWRGGPWEQPENNAPVSLPPQGQKHSRREKGEFWRRGKKRRGWLGFSILLTVIAVLIAAAALMPGLKWPGGNPSVSSGTLDPFEGQTSAQKQPTTIPRATPGGAAEIVLEPVEGELLSLQEIYEKNIASVVYIQVVMKKGYSTGSGVVLSKDGYIITNEHVISGGSSCQVVFHDDRVLDAKLVGYHTGSDLAVLKVDADDLVPAEFGNSAQLKVGDDVVAIGNPLSSNLRGTMTEGIVSAINRSASIIDANVSLIQTSAALNMGNSGGALINDRGQVVGITTMKMMSSYSTVEGLGFAIPIRFAKSIVDQIILSGEAKTPVLGITVWSDVQKNGGLLIKEVHEKSDAWAQGLRAGDLVVAADGVTIESNQTLAVIKEPLKVGDRIRLTVEREGNRFDVTVALVDSVLVS